jgi:hypothetical protein
LIDFLTFKSFISIDILIFSYYIGAIIIPIALWLSKGYLQKKIYFFDRLNQLFIAIFRELNLTKKILSILFMIFLFISMEIVWRMCFEAMIGYFQMIEALKTFGG